VTGAREITCREVVELVTDYLEGALPADRRVLFEEHLAGCEGCLTYLDQMRSTLRAVGTLTEELLPPGARDALLRAFRGWATA
jgi:anti-sigma factor RsiW